MAVTHGISGNIRHSAIPVSRLPFLKEHSIPKLRKYSGESRYGFSEDDELVEAALNELIHAMDAKDHKKMVAAVMALIDCIMTREQKGQDDNAAHS